MKTSKISYLIVGCFVLASIAGMVATIALLTGRTGATDEYHIVYNNVAGVEFGTRVVFEGFPIGQVEKITPMTSNGQTRFRVDIAVREGWRIPSDTVAEVAASGILSAVAISLSGGRSSESLSPGSEIRGGESANVLVAVSELARDISALTESDVKPLLANLGRTIGSIGNLIDQRGDSMISDLQSLTADLTEKTPIIIDKLDSFSRKINQTDDTVGRVLQPKNIQRFEAILTDLAVSSSNMATLTKDFEVTRRAVDELIVNVNTVVVDNRLDVDRSIVDLRHSVESVASHIDAINQNMEGASRNMLEFSRQLRANPGLLLGGRPAVDNAAQ